MFAALSKFCAMAAITICAWVLATSKYRARCNPKSRLIVPKHPSTRKCGFEIRLLKRFCDWRSERPRNPLCKIPSRCLPFTAPHFLLCWHKLCPAECAVLCSLLSSFQTLGSGQNWQGWYGFHPRAPLHRTEQNPCGLACPCGLS